MKKIALFSFAFAALSLASCKKGRTCTCSGTITDVTTSGGVSSTTSASDAYVETLPNATKRVAKGKADCQNRTKTTKTSYTSGGVTTTDEITEDWSCTIK